MRAEERSWAGRLPRPLVVSLLLLAGLSGCATPNEQNTPPSLGSLQVLPGATLAHVVLDVNGTFDPDGDDLTYHWAWPLGNQTTSTPKAEITFAPAAARDAQYDVAVTVRDGRGGIDQAYRPLGIRFGTGANKAPSIALAKTPRWVAPGTEVVLNASASKDADGDPLAFQWIYGPRGDFRETRGMAPASDAQFFDSGLLRQGETYNVTLDRQGTFVVHCHPHPWMRATLRVDGERAPGPPVAWPIENFQFAPRELAVGLGTTLSFRNGDPIPHTATVEHYTPGTATGGKEPIFRASLDSGEYVVRLIAADPKGLAATASWGVRVDADAPTLASFKIEGDGPLLPTGSRIIHYNVTAFEHWVDAEAKFDEPTGQGSLRVDFSSFDHGSAVYGCDPLSPGFGIVRMSCLVGTDHYAFTLSSQQVLPEWSFQVSGRPYAIPGFGDTPTAGSSDGHGHTHG